VTPAESPIPPGQSSLEGPLAAEWTRKTATVTALRVRLNAIGMRTHANWVLFRLPFDASQLKRLRRVRFRPSASVDTDVGALSIGSVCLPIPSSGPVDDWAPYTVSGIGGTDRYRVHPAPPTDDPTIFAINVPTRVANFTACGWDGGALRDPSRWTLDVTWEER
jgi:hypothetical protein